MSDRGFRSIALVVVLTVALFLTAGASVGADPSTDGSGKDVQNLRVTLGLQGAMFQADPERKQEVYVLLDTECSGSGAWQRIWGIAPQISAAFVDGVVRSGTVTGEKLEMEVLLHVPRDGWTEGGWGLYKLQLEKEKDGVYRGRYSGEYRDVHRSGKAHARVSRSEPSGLNSVQPARPEEHPRILFRKGDIPRLKKRLKTPLGNEAVKQWGDDIVSLGMRYHLLDDEDAPAKARKLLVALMKRRDCGSKMCRGRLWGTRLEQAAIGFDLFYHAWDKRFRRRVRNYLLTSSDRLLYEHSGFMKEISWSLRGEMAGPMYFGTAVAGLALWGEKGPRPTPPTEIPGTVPTVEPDRDYTPGDGVPVVKFSDDRMPVRWLMATGFRPRDGDVLQGKGAEMRPRPGMKLSFGGQTVRFKAAPDKAIWQNKKYTGGRPRLDVTAASGRAYNSANVFYTVIRNDRPRYVRYTAGYVKFAAGHSGETFLAGKRIEDGAVLRLEKGLYPLLVVSRIGETVPWGKIGTEPRLIELSKKEARRQLEELKERYRFRKSFWELEVQQWEQLDGVDVDCQRTFELSRWLMQMIYRNAVGRGGGQDVYRMHFLVGPHKYEAMHRQMFGKSVTPQQDIELYLPARLVCQILPGDGKVIEHDMQARAGFRSGSYSDDNTDLSRQMHTALFPVVPERYKPAVLWAWNYHAGVQDRDDIPRVLNASHPYAGEGYDSVNDVYAFLYYPLDMEPRHPSKVLPGTWKVPHHGHYVFRDWRKGPNDFVVRFFARTHVTSQWDQGGAEAGTFHVLGLGKKWTRSRRRTERNLSLPDDEINAKAAGRVAFEQLGRKGGVVTVNLDDVYAGSRGVTYERYGGVRIDQNFKDLGISGLRSFGVDYSGDSGAPCLIVIVDSVDGGGRKTWDIPFRGVRGSWSDGSIECTGGGQDAKVYGRVATTKEAERNARKQGDRISRIKTKGAGRFFAVFTIQKDKAPAIDVQGRGLDAQFTIGDRVIRFDGKKIVFEKAGS